MNEDEADLKRKIHAAMARSKFGEVRRLLDQLTQIAEDQPEGPAKERLLADIERLRRMPRRHRHG